MFNSVESDSSGLASGIDIQVCRVGTVEVFESTQLGGMFQIPVGCVQQSC